MTEAVLLIACHNGRRCIGECLDSLLKSHDPGIESRIIVADNASSDGSAEFIAEKFPTVELLRLPGNLGFTGGINAAWENARRKCPDATIVAILNQDIIARDGWLAAMVAHLGRNPAVAAVQPKVLLWHRKDRFNTAGNQSHYLGFGFVTGYGQPDNQAFTEPREIDFPSGAATVIRRETLGNGPILEDLFFLYLEDAELGWRLRQMGYRVDYVPAGAVWHQYSFHEDYRYYFFLERNRWYLLAMYYKMPTLLVLLPAIVAMEIGQFYFAWTNGVLRQKTKACAFFLYPANLTRLRRRRRMAQARRRIGDRQFVGHFTGNVDFPELRSTMLRRIGNPMLNCYWAIARRIIFW
jgi:GT2 family glycosyltransferase